MKRLFLILLLLFALLSCILADLDDSFPVDGAPDYGNRERHAPAAPPPVRERGPQANTPLLNSLVESLRRSRLPKTEDPLEEESGGDNSYDENNSAVSGDMDDDADQPMVAPGRAPAPALRRGLVRPLGPIVTVPTSSSQASEGDLQDTEVDTQQEEEYGEDGDDASSVAQGSSSAPEELEEEDEQPPRFGHRDLRPKLNPSLVLRNLWSPSESPSGLFGRGTNLPGRGNNLPGTRSKRAVDSAGDDSNAWYLPDPNEPQISSDGMTPMENIFRRRKRAAPQPQAQPADEEDADASPEPEANPAEPETENEDDNPQRQPVDAEDADASPDANPEPEAEDETNPQPPSTAAISSPEDTVAAEDAAAAPKDYPDDPPDQTDREDLEEFGEDLLSPKEGDDIGVAVDEYGNDIVKVEANDDNGYVRAGGGEPGDDDELPEDLEEDGEEPTDQDEIGKTVPTGPDPTAQGSEQEEEDVLFGLDDQDEDNEEPTDQNETGKTGLKNRNDDEDDEGYDNAPPTKV